MKIRKLSIGWTLFVFLILLVVISCKKDTGLVPQNQKFMLSSPDIGADSLLPAEYTCDGLSSTLPLAWTGAPEKTVCFALIMHHIASPTDIHWYWVLYNIPANTNNLPKNTTGIGILGTNSVNDRTGYAPPCSQGPGIKAYTYTIYSLSQPPVLPLPADKVTRLILLDAIEDITISSAKMTVYYSRNI